MFETISVPLLTSIITPLSIIFCLLCLLATTVIFLYWREKCEKGSDMSNSLLLIVFTSKQLLSLCPSSHTPTRALSYLAFSSTSTTSVERSNWSPSFFSVSSSFGGNYTPTTTSLSGNVHWKESLGWQASHCLPIRSLSTWWSATKAHSVPKRSWRIFLSLKPFSPNADRVNVQYRCLDINNYLLDCEKFSRGHIYQANSFQLREHIVFATKRGHRGNGNGRDHF